MILNKIKIAALQEGIKKEIIIVDDHSTDNTAEIVRQYIQENPSLEIRLHCQPENKGKGAALHKAIELASGEFILIQDADREYDPRDYPLLLQPILEGNADVVYGSRFISGKPRKVLFFWHSIGNKFLTTISNLFTNLNLTDMETCYKVFKAEIIKNLELKEKRFGFEPEVTAKISRVPRIRICEVGISYYGRSYEEGKKIGWRDGLRALYCVVKYNLFSR